MDKIDSRIDGESYRIDKLIAMPDELPENTDEVVQALAKELTDIRTRYNGNTYDSARGAVRAIDQELEALRDGLSQYIDTEAINGLHYDYTGEVGLKQPYMLYLTANDEVITESGVQIISGAGTGGGGSATNSSLTLNYITTSPVVITEQKDVKLYFTFSGTDSSGDPITQASSTWQVNGEIVAYGTVHSGENYFDVTKYLSTGTTKILLTVVDDNKSVVTKNWSVQLVELSITSDFDDKLPYSVGETIPFSYTPTGAVDKTVTFKLDGKNIISKTLLASVSGTEVPQDLPAQEHGAHLLEVIVEATTNTGLTIPPAYLAKSIICYDPANPKPIISTITKNIEMRQYATSNILYTVYDSTTETPKVCIEVDGTIVSEPTITGNPEYNGTPTAIFPYTAIEPGTHTIKITRGNASPVIISVYVEELDIDVSPITDGLAFDFNPLGKINPTLVDADNVWNYNNIKMSVSDNFDWTNGGYIPDDPDGACFCIKAGSTATIDYELFGDDAKTFGKEFKLVFKTTNVADPEAVFLSCVDNTTDKDHIGIQMGVQKANIYGQSNNLELVYSEDDVIEFEFNISKATDTPSMIMGYEDGVPTRPLVYDSSFNFKQNSPKQIVLGSPDCDLYIYRFKVYKTSLSNANILRNFIADARTTDEMIARQTRNLIYDENNQLNPIVLAEKCPWLRVYMLEAPRFTTSKSDKVSNTTIRQIYGAGDKTLDNWICYNAQHSGQGTSSNNYGAAGRNLDFIMNGSDTYFTLGDGTIAREITLTRNSVPVAYLNAKVNIASSNNLTNAILANRYNQFNPYKRPFVRPDGYPVSNIKDTMEFYNCVIFIKESDPDFSTHKEFNDDNWHFYAIGNIGDSKKTDNTRLTDPSDPYECCVEIMDVKLPLSDFPIDTKIAGHSEDANGNIQYSWSKTENLGILYEFNGDSFVKSVDEKINPDKTYYVNIDGNMQEASSSDLTDFNLGILYEREYALTEDTEVNLNKTYYIDLPKKVTASATDLTEENLVNEKLYDRVYRPTEDTEVIEGKVYYESATGTVVTKDELKDITNPSEAGLFEWRREYKIATDSEIIAGKTYYIEVYEKVNAMEYTYQDVRNYLWAKPENLGILYEYIDGAYELAAEVDLTKTYYIKVEEKDADDNIIAVNYVDAMGYTVSKEKVYTYATNENLNRLYEISYFKTPDTILASASEKTYYVDILEQDDFSEDYTYGWRYSSNKKDKSITSYCKQKWIEFYRFVTTSSDRDFKEHLEDYFIIDSALYYYLFTERYCMVDNRAKNTFWHYGKDADGTRKWDLCWDYDNDTSLGLNNYGKQVYRYGLEDIDVDDTGEEVFREMDSLFFCRLRDLFADELKAMYRDLESKNAWHAESFINKCDEWQNEFPEELWRLDIDRKYIRTYSSSFINGKGDNQFLVNMCNGKMKYQRRQWERNQEQYMASKYQTGRASDDSYHANFRFGGPNTANPAVPADYRLTLTPYSYMYLNVQYGGTSPSTVRVTDANINTPITVPFFGNAADIVNVYSASSIRDFGDLSKCYPKTVSIGNASRVKNLKLGNDTVGYDNTVFTTLTTDANPLLENLDITNMSSFTQTLDLRRLINLKTLKAFGTNAPSAMFAEGGKLNYVELPAVNGLTLKDLPYLSTDNIKLSSYDKVVDLTIEACPLVDQKEMLSRCTKLQRVRLIGVDLGTLDYDYFENNLFKLKGFTATNITTDNAYITGTCFIQVLTGAQYKELTSRYPQLQISFGTINTEVNFKATDDTLFRSVSVIGYDSSGGEISANELDSYDIRPTWPENDAFSYQFVGWSKTKQEYKGITGSEYEQDKYLHDTYPDAFDGTSLTDILEPRDVYPVFKAIRKSYNVTFKNTFNLAWADVTIEVPYGSVAAYDMSIYPEPTKTDEATSYLYEFIGWLDADMQMPAVIIGEIDYFAQFKVKDQNKFIDEGVEGSEDDSDTDPGYTISIHDLVGIDTNGNTVEGYSIDENTIRITRCYNKFNPVIQIPETIKSATGDATYQVTSVTGFGSNNKLEMVFIPDTITTFGYGAFSECSNLYEVRLPSELVQTGNAMFSGCSTLSKIQLPESLTTISESTFDGCRSLRDLYIPKNVSTIGPAAFRGCTSVSVSPDNEYFTLALEGKCLLKTYKVPTGLDASETTVVELTQAFEEISEIPATVTKLAPYCFSKVTSITSVDIPEVITEIPNNAFMSCTNLESVTFNGKITVLNATCFYNTALKAVTLPEGLEKISSYVFANTELASAKLPASITALGDHAFGNLSTLESVKFCRKADGTYNIPDIHKETFSGADNITGFKVPWTVQEHYDNFCNNPNKPEASPTFGSKALYFNADVDESGNITSWDSNITFNSMEVN